MKETLRLCLTFRSFFWHFLNPLTMYKMKIQVWTLNPAQFNIHWPQNLILLKPTKTKILKKNYICTATDSNFRSIVCVMCLASERIPNRLCLIVLVKGHRDWYIKCTGSCQKTDTWLFSVPVRANLRSLNSIYVRCK